MVKSYICYVLSIPLLTQVWDPWIYKMSKWSSHASEPETGCKNQETFFLGEFKMGAGLRNQAIQLMLTCSFALERENNWCCVVKMKEQ